MGTWTPDHPFTEDDLNLRGVDTPDRRPGVPMEYAAHPSPDDAIPRQQPRAKVLMRSDLDGLTPVFGTAQPPRGLSGALRALAYRIPDHHRSHWVALMLADRVDVIEHGAGRPLKWVALGVPVAAFIGMKLLRRRSGWRRVFT